MIKLLYTDEPKRKTKNKSWIMTTRSKYIGCIVGLILGDALCAPYEIAEDGKAFEI